MAKCAFGAHAAFPHMAVTLYGSDLIWQVQAALLKSLVSTAKAAGLVPLEHVTGAYPLLEPWLTENGCLTATLKLVPKAVFKRHDKELKVVSAKGRRS